MGRAQHHAPVCSKATRARRTGFYHGVGAPTVQGSGPSLCLTPKSQGVSYVQVSGFGEYIRNLIPIRTTLPRRRSWAVWAGAMLNFAITEFSEVRARLRMVAPCIQWKG